MASPDSPDSETYLNYYESYVDCVDNLPLAIQKKLSRIKEMDISYAALTKKIPVLVNELVKKDDDARRKKLQSTLLYIQDLQLFKLETIQRICETVQIKSDELERDYNLLDPNVDHLNSSPGENTTKENNLIRSEQQRQNKRSKQSSKYTTAGDDKDHHDYDKSSNGNRSNSETVTTVALNASTKVGTLVTKKKKYKSSSKRTQKGSKEGNMQEILDNAGIDHPDEPIYCLCDRVSYGQMICCDNDLCPIEWFHFDCVSLTIKPKGKWFCPMCRGDRANIMKRKSVFLKELEKYNKEKEEKASRRY